MTDKKLRPEVFAFAKLMSDKLDANQEEKGHSWREMSFENLFELMQRQEAEIYYDDNELLNCEKKRLVNIANYCLMMWEHLDEIDRQNEADYQRIIEKEKTG